VPVGEPGEHGGAHRHARDRERDRDQPQAREAGVDLPDEISEDVVERRASALAEDGLEHVAEAPVADEEREHLVLVRRQCMEAQEQERAERRGDTADAEPEAVADPREGSTAPRRGWHSGVPSAGSPRPPC
jgi:hypothetical protein